MSDRQTPSDDDRRGQSRLGDDLVPDDLFAAPDRQRPAPERPEDSGTREALAPGHDEPVSRTSQVGQLPHARHDRERRLWAAGNVMVAIIIGFGLATLLNAASIEHNVSTGMRIGFGRSLALGLIKPAHTVSSWLGLDEPRKLVDRALGRKSQNHAAVVVPAKPVPPVKHVRIPTKARPLRLWVGGDSMAMVFGQSLVGPAARSGVVKLTRIGSQDVDYHSATGLSRPDAYDWEYHLDHSVLPKKPEAMVVMLGANDGQSVEYHGRVLQFGTPSWLKLYHHRVGRAMNIMRESAVRIYWVGLPIMRSTTFSHTVAIMNEVYRQEAAKRSWARFIPSWNLFAKNGHYTAYLKDDSGELQLMRGEDGIHFTRAGGDRLARRVFAIIAADWHISP